MEFADEPGVVRKVWLFTMVLGHSRWLWGRFVRHARTCRPCCAATSRPSPPWRRAGASCLYDRMKTAVIGEDADGVVSYNASLVALLNHYGALPRACRPYRAKTKGKIERPYRYIRQDFFLGRTFRDLDDLNAQFEAWRTEIANRPRPCHHPPRRRRALRRGAAAPDRPSRHPLQAVLTIERRISHEGMVSVGGNLYSVPDTARKRVVEVQNHPSEVRIFEDGTLIARHPRARRQEPAPHRSGASQGAAGAAARALPATGRRRPLAFYDAVGRRLAGGGSARDRAARPHPRRLVGLRMPRALEALDHTLSPPRARRALRHRGDRRAARPRSTPTARPAASTSR